MAIKALEIEIEQGGTPSAQLTANNGEHGINKSTVLSSDGNVEDLGTILIGSSVILRLALDLEHPVELFRRPADSEDETMTEVDGDEIELQAGDRVECDDIVVRVVTLEFDEPDPTNAPDPTAESPAAATAAVVEVEGEADELETTLNAPLGADEEAEPADTNPDNPGVDGNGDPSDTPDPQAGGAGEENPMDIEHDPIAAAIGGPPIEDPADTEEELEEGDEVEQTAESTTGDEPEEEDEEARAEAERQAQAVAARAAEEERANAEAARLREEQERAEAEARAAEEAEQERLRQAGPPTPVPPPTTPPEPEVTPPTPANRESGGGTSGWLIAGLVTVALMALLAMGIGAFAVMTAVNGDARLARDLPPTSVQVPAGADTVLCSGDGASLTHNGRFTATGAALYSGRVSFVDAPGAYDVYSVRDVVKLSDGTCGDKDGNAISRAKCSLSNVSVRAKPDANCGIERTYVAPGKGS